MRIRGSALLARKSIVARQFGEQAWVDLLKDIAVRHPFFTQPVLATTTVPLDEFLAFHDELVLRFYGGQPRTYLVLGEQSARWAVTEGPYKNFIANRDFEAFVRFFPRTWSTYFLETGSHCSTSLDSAGRVDFRAFDLPVWHPYFEHFVVGYFKGCLELIAATPIHVTRVHGGNEAGYHYQLVRAPPRPAGKDSGPSQN